MIMSIGGLKRLWILAGVLAMGLWVEAWALGPGDKGTSGAQFLKLAPGARPAALGEAFSAVADDVHAVYYNPAGLGFLKKVELAAMHNDHFQGISHNFGAVAVPMLSWVDTDQERNTYGVLALSLTSLSVDGIERRGVVETDQASESFGARDLAYTLAYGYAFSESLSLGATGKFIDQNLDSANAKAGALDSGLLYRYEKLAFGAGFRNLGTQVKFRSESDPLPFLAYAGASFKPNPHWFLASDIRVPRDNSLKFSVGSEFRKPITAHLSGALRGGYNSSNTDADGFGGVTLGAGLGYGHFEMDFAWVPFGDLGNTFRYSLLVRF